ncbi:purine nucleoside permease [Alloacidobacterium dinghuense]|uniref:Purine nucleoside permease n=1 Tax=Alloacidobacterium dinghuense TaxID=2763107 RepID=A0A7G8BDD5_9BACT|nr:purine nucleoside permease [Alloacidobacterium dinghuense]QNI30555.1 purine nucleoside permease [Alloacidobacterium dinghuense]
MRFCSFRSWSLSCLLLCLLFSFCATASAETPILVKVVVVAMYEQGADTGDAPGEFQFWVEREHLDKVIPFPAGNHDLRMNSNGVLGVLTGVGTAKAASTIMALGIDPRFDLTHAYWIVAGIAGGNPANTSLGSAVWAHWVVDGDLAHEIDAREIPADWPTGYVPLRKATPYEQPVNTDLGEVYELNAPLVAWAYQLTKDVPLQDNAAMAERRSHFSQPTAKKPPFVFIGDDLSSSTFWHGAKMDAWANAWVSYFTEGKGNFAVTGMEDTGTLQSLKFLAHAGKADWNRILILRTVSNYDQPPPGMTAWESLAGEKAGKYSAFLPALESAYAVGHVVVDKLVEDWPRVKDQVPRKESK